MLIDLNSRGVAPYPHLIYVILVVTVGAATCSPDCTIPDTLDSGAVNQTIFFPVTGEVSVQSSRT